ncbi:HNH endonuclease [Rhodoferax sp. 4810]|uniref:HNH endonuclease n=1 Tax=Thiospirillum jenense TaxID=1653858 RepID=A0A839HB64_9GAMM|nr:HNH endonuclease signature motif containing protein [Thiospirillum jenense]MBB1074696.1 HNH endonuclease [Rhodoferax jenense]MBB1125460.1 HNH endonuclease [Thiospirillum jenense]
MTQSIKDLLITYFKNHPFQDCEHGPVVDWVTEQWLLEHDNPPRDPWRSIRHLHEEGFLIKVSKGIYRYDPNYIVNNQLENFTDEQRKAIFERDHYRCVICGRGYAEGVEIHADHIKPKNKGGEASILNGQTLCAEHNLRKKNYQQTELGKRMFIRLDELATANQDDNLKQFCTEIFRVFEKYHIDDHIK